MAAVDLTNYTEVDPGGDLTITSTTLTVDGIADGTNAYAYRDMGVAFVDDGTDFTDTFVFSLGVDSGGDHVIAHYNNTAGGFATNINGIGVTWYGDNGGAASGLYLHEYRVGLSIVTDLAVAGSALSLDTPYYCRFSYVTATSTLSLEVFSDEAMTSQVGVTASFVISNDFSLRYHYIYTSNSATAIADEATFTVSNYDLGAFAGEAPALSLTSPKGNTRVSFNGDYSVIPQFNTRH